MERGPMYFVDLIGRILFAANDKDFKKLNDLKGDRRIKDLDLHRLEDWEFLTVKFKNLSLANESRHPNGLKLAFFSLDSVLMKLYYDGVFIVLASKQHLEYLAIMDLVSPPKDPPKGSLLPGVKVSGNLDCFRAIDKHIKKCSRCAVIEDAYGELWRKGIKDQLGSSLL